MLPGSRVRYLEGRERADLIELASRPITIVGGGGYDAPMGTFAFDPGGSLWYKYGPLDTDWLALAGMRGVIPRTTIPIYGDELPRWYTPADLGIPGYAKAVNVRLSVISDTNRTTAIMLGPGDTTGSDDYIRVWTDTTWEGNADIPLNYETEQGLYCHWVGDSIPGGHTVQANIYVHAWYL